MAQVNNSTPPVRRRFSLVWVAVFLGALLLVIPVNYVLDYKLNYPETRDESLSLQRDAARVFGAQYIRNVLDTGEPSSFYYTYPDGSFTFEDYVSYRWWSWPERELNALIRAGLSLLVSIGLFGAAIWLRCRRQLPR